MAETARFSCGCILLILCFGLLLTTHAEIQDPDDVIRTGKRTEENGFQNQEDNIFDPDKYLERYGYLTAPEEPATGRPAHSEHQRRHAITQFQKFAHLPETGELNKVTVRKMLEPRCGVRDIMPDHDPSNPLEYNAGPKWSTNSVTWKLHTLTDKLTEAEQRTAIVNAFQHWTDASGLTVQPTRDSADINIEFTSGNHGDGFYNAFHGPGGTLAHAFLPVDGRVHFDTTENWVLHRNDGTELETVTIHELGHALGLSHSTVRGSVMAPFYREYQPDFALHRDDVAGIQSLYGAPTTTTTTTTTTAPPTVTVKPKACFKAFDAITLGPNGYIYLFIGSLVYKLNERCRDTSCVVPGYPKPIRKLFKRGPKSVSAATFVPDHRQRTFLFRGRKMWRYTGFKLDKGYPKQMSKQDMPYRPSAAYVQKNQFSDYQLYLFGGKHFWELSLHTERKANSNMRVREYWARLPKIPDAMMQTADGNIYVFKGKGFMTYNHLRYRVKKKIPAAPVWLGHQCR